MILSPAAKSDDGSVSDFDISTLAMRSIAAAYHGRVQACRLSCRCGSPKYTARLDHLRTVLSTNAGISCRCDQQMPLREEQSLMSESRPSRRSRLIAGTVCMQWCVWQRIRKDTRYNEGCNGAWHDLLNLLVFCFEAEVNEELHSVSPRLASGTIDQVRYRKATSPLLNASLATCTRCFKNTAQAENRHWCRDRGLDLVHVLERTECLSATWKLNLELSSRIQDSFA